MEHENKTRIPAWLRPSTIRHMDGWLEEANCKSRSELIEKSLHFYMGYLGAEDASEYLSNALTATLRGIAADSANRTNSLLFKCAVEQGIMSAAFGKMTASAKYDAVFPLLQQKPLRLIDRSGFQRLCLPICS